MLWLRKTDVLSAGVVTMTRYLKASVLCGLALAAAASTGNVSAKDIKITATYDHGGTTFMLATGSPGELGLLKALAAAFAKTTPATLKWVKAGSGASLTLMKARTVDMVMVHAPAAEAAAVKDGWATSHTLIGSNEFYIVGPKSDPAGIKGAKSAAGAYARIAKAKANFVTRGDNSGTHKKELRIWKAAGVTPSGTWYVVSHDFMTASLMKANTIGGYFMTDSSTWVAERKAASKLTVLFKGDKVLVNTYHALLSAADTPGKAVAAKFIAFVGSAAGQKVIRDYGVKAYGEALYQDAAYAKKFVH
jgi:tungstate transport system substrate-binding protein